MCVCVFVCMCVCVFCRVQVYSNEVFNLQSWKLLITTGTVY